MIPPLQVFPLAPAGFAERLRAARRHLQRWFDAVRLSNVSRSRRRRRQAEWAVRIRDVMSCPDLDRIPRVPGAGAIVGRYQTMHNGLQILDGSYYGWRCSSMFVASGGVHEPQEELVFAAVIEHIASRCDGPGDPGAVMLELGAYWGFYSLWFASRVPCARCILVEPVADNLDMGMANARLNADKTPGARFEFLRAAVGASPGTDPTLGRVTTVDELVECLRLNRIDILHADVQHAEHAMLLGSEGTLRRNLVRFAFVSTHSAELHTLCRDHLLRHGFRILADADLEDTYSTDGIIVACHHTVTNPPHVSISLRRSTAACSRGA